MAISPHPGKDLREKAAFGLAGLAVMLIGCARPAEESGVGIATNHSDVSGQPSSPIETGTVLFVPAAQVTTLARLAGAESVGEAQFRHKAFDVPPEAVAALDATAASIGSGGRFPVSVAGGRYFLCLADIFVDHAAGPPYSIVGCAEMNLPVTPAAALNLTFGEGGVAAR